MSVNIVDGQLVNVSKPNLLFMEALNYSLDKVPYGKYALVFVDDRDVTGSVLHELYNSFHQRKKPQIFTGTEETANLKKWLREPKERENDFCIVISN